MITIVSGLPRSGTSLMMQMLVAGGMLPLADGERAPDDDNPRGYLEWERIKTLPQDPACIAQAEGMVVKVISKLLLALPAGPDYRIVFMERPMSEVLASQAKMLQRRGAPSSASADHAMAAAFERHLQEVFAWMEKIPGVKSLRLGYHSVLAQPAAAADQLSHFLSANLNTAAMLQAVDASLYRNRS